MYMVKEFFIASDGHVYSEGDELTAPEYEALTAEERNKVTYYKDDDDEYTGYNDTADDH